MKINRRIYIGSFSLESKKVLFKLMNQREDIKSIVPCPVANTKQRSLWRLVEDIRGLTTSQPHLSDLQKKATTIKPNPARQQQPTLVTLQIPPIEGKDLICASIQFYKDYFTLRYSLL